MYINIRIYIYLHLTSYLRQLAYKYFANPLVAKKTVLSKINYRKPEINNLLKIIKNTLTQNSYMKLYFYTL